MQPHPSSYTPLGQRASLTEKIGTLVQPAQAETNRYDAWDNRLSQSKNGQTRHAEYDAAQQLIAERSGSPTGPLVAAYLYDADGNLTRKCEGGTVTRSGGTCTGAVITQHSWNPYGELIKVEKTGQPTEEYRYDASGRRIIKLINGQATHTVYDGQDAHAEYQGWSQAKARYTHGPGTDEPLIRTSANQTRYYHQDGLGSIVATTDGTGTTIGLNQYDAWGNPQQQSGQIDRYGYTGREPDGTGYIYYRARYYDPTIGRFISRDPSGMPDGVNRYVYVGNDPVNFTDPTGEFGIAGAVGSVLLGGVIRGFSGEAIFDARAIATDAVLGAVGAGLASRGVKAWQTIQSQRQGVANYLGKLGERAMGIKTPNEVRIPSVTGKPYTKPDGFRGANVLESKNKARLSSGDRKQILDEVNEAQQRGGQVILGTRRSTNTRVVDDLIESGAVRHINLRGIGDDGFRYLTSLESGTIGAGFGQGTQALYNFATGDVLAPYSGGVDTGVKPGK